MDFSHIPFLDILKLSNNIYMLKKSANMYESWDPEVLKPPLQCKQEKTSESRESRAVIANLKHLRNYEHIFLISD